MKFLLVCLVLITIQLVNCNENSKLKIGIKKRVENCDMKSRKQDLLHVKVSFMFVLCLLIKINVYDLFSMLEH